MPHIKHFQQIADLHHSFDALYRLRDDYAALEAAGGSSLRYRKQAACDYIYQPDTLSLEELLALAKVEDDVFVYLLAVENGVARGDAPVLRPDADVAIAVFQGRIDRMCQHYNVDEAGLGNDPFFGKLFKACSYYRFMFSLPGWVKQLPESVPDMQTKYNK